MTTRLVNQPQSSTIVEHTYDPNIQYQRAGLTTFEEGGTLSTLANVAKPQSGQQRAFVYNENPQGLVQERVLGKIIPGADGRKQITKTTQWPYSLHAQLTILFKGKLYGGSGAMVGPHHLLTCGHNVYDHQTGTWADRITVYPALNDNYAPFGEIKVTKVYTFTNWTDRTEKQYDIALLILSESIGKYTGWGGLVSTENQELSKEDVNITGYPGDMGMKQMWGMKYKIHTIAPEEFEYLIDTSPGQSGSAIWINKLGTPMILGVHTLGGNDMNFGVRISQHKFKAIIQKISDNYKLEKTMAVQNPIQITMPLVPQITIPLHQQTKIPSMAFGAEAWKKYFGDVDVEPPLPSNIDEILNAQCPFWPAKKVKDTHLLVLVPQTVHEKPLTLKSLGELIQKPLQGNATQYQLSNRQKVLEKRSGLFGEYTDPPASQSHWVLLTRDVIDGSKDKSYSDQQALIASFSLKANVLYQVPTILDATICILMEYVQTGTRLYNNSSPTYTVCQEQFKADKVITMTTRKIYGGPGNNNERRKLGTHLGVGNFSSDGLDIRKYSYRHYSDTPQCSGVGALRKL